MRPLQQNRLLGSQTTGEEKQIFCLPRITFEFGPRCANWTVRRGQFPLCLAYATTFNSFQGLKLDPVVRNSTMAVFALGQLYISLSRTRRGAEIQILQNPWSQRSELSTAAYPFRMTGPSTA